ncbi:MAG: DUF1838 domain-containing protein [Alphaproteobacteria bacterium]|nr:DUF1838 domain-containing protein [Alphaproteobacteria bacterium]
MIRTLIASVATLVCLSVSGAALAQAQFDINNPDDLFLMNRKQTCTLKEGTPVLHWWTGKMYGRRAGEKDRHLFNVQGMNVRQCKFFDDPKRGPGYRSVSREIMLHLDPVTNAMLKTWKNPWTGEEVEVMNVANDPVSMRAPTYARDENGKPVAAFRYIRHGDYFLSGGGAARLFYKNVLAGEYQEYVGGDYHAMEFGTGAINAAQMLSRTAEITDSVLSWGRVSKWLPWMKMGDKDGVVVYHTAGIRAVKGYSEIPEPMASELKTTYAVYQAPPPVDDARINETTWTVFKSLVDGKRAAAEKK